MDNYSDVRMVMRAAAGLAAVIALAVLSGCLVFGMAFLPAAGLAVFAWVGSMLCLIALGGCDHG